jgi:hypothetical protein
MADGELFDVRDAVRNNLRNIGQDDGPSPILESVRAVGLVIVVLALLASLIACSKPQQPETADAPKTTGLESIPEPDSSKFPDIGDMRDWKNPYFVVREDGIGLVDLSSREIHLLKQEEVPAELVSLPSSAWPYGRVVLITQAIPTNLSAQTKEELRKNRGLLIGTLKELDVQVREVP